MPFVHLLSHSSVCERVFSNKPSSSIALNDLEQDGLGGVSCMCGELEALVAVFLLLSTSVSLTTAEHVDSALDIPLRSQECA